MIARITRHKDGIVDYLLKGIRADSSYTRQDKDNVVSIYGNLDTLDKSIKYLNENKDYKDNYTHITISFSKNDINKLDEMDQLQREQTLKDITETYIKHHTKGYDLKNEVIAYAEAHKPKIKTNEIGNERLEHIHIVISHQNALNNTRLRTTFANTFIDDTLQSYINKKYEFDNPKEHKRENITANASRRQYFKNELKDIKRQDELIKYFEKNNLKYKEVKTKRNHYYKISYIQDNKEISINLRGKDFKHLELLTANKEYEFPHTKDTQDLENILNSYYEKREKEISKRRSKADTEKLADYNKPYLSNKQEEEPSISFYNKPKKIKAKIYKDIAYMKGYKTNAQKNLTTLFNKEKNIKIQDKKDKLSVNFSTCNDKAQAVNDMLEIALAKGWKLDQLEISGSDEFKKEAYKQIKQRLEQEKKSKLYEVERVKTPIQEIIKNKQDNIILHSKERLNDIKKNIDTRKVLKYAQEHYKINIFDYEITQDNKINNKTNKQKPKSVIDFLNKDIGLTLKDSINVLNNIYEEQLKEKNKYINKESLSKSLNKNNIINTNINNIGENMKISITKDTKENPTQGWEQVELKGFNSLINVVTSYPYSVANFTDSRNQANVKSFNQFLVYDIDNDKDKPNLSIKQAKELINKQDIKALIIPTKSHNIEKNGHTAERFRIIIPLKEPLKNTDREIYRETQKIISDRLGLTSYIDTKAAKDTSRFYYPSPKTAVLKAEILTNNNFLNITEDEKLGKENHLKKMQSIQNKAIQFNTKYIKDNEYKYSTEYLNIIDYQEILSKVDIQKLIPLKEEVKEIYSDSEKYLYYKTDDAKYSIINADNTNLAYDLKTDETYNSVTYLEKKLNTKNLTTINNYLKDNGMGDYSRVNSNAVYKTMEKNKDNIYSINDIKNIILETYKIKCSSKVNFMDGPTLKLKVFDNTLDFGPTNTQKIKELIKNNNDKKRKLEEQQQPQPQIQTFKKTTKAKEKDIQL